MTARPIDPEDPFGSRMDEKPPDGWNDRYWDAVRERIEIRRQDPGSSLPPEPPGPSRRGRRAAITAGIAVAVSIAALGQIGERGRPATPRETATLVRVDGSEEPPVAVEWARSNGRRSGYVVFRSLEPEISFVSLPLPDATTEIAEEAKTGAAIVRGETGRVLMQIYRGDIRTSSREVSTTTIFREHSYTAPPADPPPGEDVTDQVRDIFSLEKVSSLGSSMVRLFGGVAVVDDEGREVRIQMRGQPVGDRSVRLVISQQRDGEEDFATSVVARHGKTVMLAGPPSRIDGRDVMLFVRLTPLPIESPASRG